MEVIKDEYISKIEVVRILQKAYAEGRIKANDGLSSVLDDIQNADVQPVCKALKMRKLTDEEAEIYEQWLNAEATDVQPLSVIAADVQPINRWISVDEALPENENEMLVWYEYFRYGEYNCMYQTYGLGSYIQRYSMWSGDDLNGTKVKVLYWQPLPEPPKEE